MTFYLKYRPKNLKELDLREVATTLEKILETDSLPHAFLFAGPKGTGKTSAARIMAMQINCTEKVKSRVPCGTCDQCISIMRGSNLDVIELDAASNRGIDDIRTLKDAIKLAPALGKKKIYIIDEAHMLTTEASNALLKTLEEPPSHVIFILATTNPEKLIDTIRSRATIINFRKATDSEIVNSLKRIIAGENLKVDTETIELIAKRAGGAFRDGAKLLEQVTLEGSGFLENSEASVTRFIDGLYGRSRDVCLNTIADCEKKGIVFDDFLKNVLLTVQSDLVKGNHTLIDLAEVLLEASSRMKDSPIDSLPLQIAAIKWCGGHTPSAESIDEKALEITVKLPDVPVAAQEVPVSDLSTSVDSEIWQKVLSTVKPINATLEALLRTSKPLNYDGRTLTLGVYYKFHKERLEDSTHRKIVEDIVTKVLNNNTRIECTLVDVPISAPLTEDKDEEIVKVAEELFS